MCCSHSKKFRFCSPLSLARLLCGRHSFSSLRLSPKHEESTWHKNKFFHLKGWFLLLRLKQPPWICRRLTCLLMFQMVWQKICSQDYCEPPMRNLLRNWVKQTAFFNIFYDYYKCHVILVLFIAVSESVVSLHSCWILLWSGFSNFLFSICLHHSTPIEFFLPYFLL